MFVKNFGEGEFVIKSQRVDMHVHTKASDGSFGVCEIIQMAKREGLAGLSITDHDNVGCVAEAVVEAKKEGILLIPGIEISCTWQNKDVHILGYDIDFAAEWFLAELLEMQGNRAKRAEQILARLAELGYPLSTERVWQLAGSGSIGRPHIALAMVEVGYVPSIAAAFGGWLSQGGRAYVPRPKYTPQEAIKLIVKAGGVAVWSHPGLAKCDEIIEDLMALGLVGLEVYNPGHNTGDEQHYLALAKRLGLFVTGGSDFHANNFARFTTPLAVVEKMLDRQIKKD